MRKFFDLTLYVFMAIWGLRVEDNIEKEIKSAAFNALFHFAAITFFQIASIIPLFDRKYFGMKEFIGTTLLITALYAIYIFRNKHYLQVFEEYDSMDRIYLRKKAWQFILYVMSPLIMCILFLIFD